MNVTIYTDGAARGNPGRGGYGAVLRYTAPSGKRYTIVLMFNNYTCTRTQLKQKIAAWLTATLSKKE